MWNESVFRVMEIKFSIDPESQLKNYQEHIGKVDRTPSRNQGVFKQSSLMQYTPSPDHHQSHQFTMKKEGAESEPGTPPNPFGSKAPPNLDFSDVLQQE